MAHSVPTRYRVEWEQGMAMQEQEPSRQLGYLAGRMEEQSKALQGLKDGQIELSRRIDVGLEEVRAGQQELSRKVDNGLQEVRAGQRQLVVTLLLVAGGLFATLVGSVAALLVRLT